MGDEMGSLDFLELGAVGAARELIGWRLYIREADSSLTGGRIVETEAYTQEDMASHSYRGQTPRNEIMFGRAGRVYVYFTYGMHWCMNIVTGKKDQGEAVLIRAIEADKGVDHIMTRRPGRPEQELTNGPAKLCQALDISGADNGAKLNQSRFILLQPLGPRLEIEATERIGIKNDRHRLWRFTGRTQNGMFA